jgi:hypothetical protein
VWWAGRAGSFGGWEELATVIGRMKWQLWWVGGLAMRPAAWNALFAKKIRE